MSDPLSEQCLYCGSPALLDDAWFCDRRECWQAYDRGLAEQQPRGGPWPTDSYGDPMAGAFDD